MDMTKQHILIVEEKEKIALTLIDHMQKAGYFVSRLYRGEEVITFLRKNSSDLIIMDILLPDITALEVYLRVREFSDIPILMIKSSIEKIDRLIILGPESSEYIHKTFNPKEVVVCVQAVLRKSSASHAENKIANGALELNEYTRQVFINAHELKLTPIEFDLLKVMLIEPNHVFTRNQLMNLAKGYNSGNERTLDTHIKNLRKKISTFLPDRQIICSVYGIGYKLNDKDLGTI